MRQGVPTIINPYDLFALEEALRLKDQFGAKVTVLTMGPKMADQALRKALTFGADEAILLTDRAFAGSDTLATSYALSSAVAKIGQTDPIDIVFCGKQTIDGDTAQVGPGIATRLNLQQLTYVSKIVSIDKDARQIVVHRRAEGGVQVLKTAMPCLITMLEDTNHIRFGTMADAFRAARYTLTEWSATEAGVPDVTHCGLRGSPTVVKKVFAPTAKTVKATPIAGDTPESLSQTLIDTLFSAHPGLQEDLESRVASNSQGA
ncbi:electron transfer flavoprotein subunit beta/FixA family protein [Telmatospirillum sp.]|uniref:electron transfer flavoprotein subunit beta/FixA family protein n=1 Tax=Telmatospirillum sp. TaxID=2079197 RepID=UPI0028467E54|nr:electron transfer flavoprotein subunit beta/FixA family protein [Telmatospirillum sp.]MDR3436245.1 electron transfer flavoprotein subunit beta/FixA family protein [Telmatospirillum sp.]